MGVASKLQLAADAIEDAKKRLNRAKDDAIDLINRKMNEFESN